MKKLRLLIMMFTITTITNAQTPSYVSHTNLLGWWSFSGNAIDSSGNGYDGIVSGATLTTDRFGKVNAAYHFIDDTISTNCPGIINDSARTISFWAKVENGSDITNEWFFMGYGTGAGIGSGFDINLLANAPGIDGAGCYAFYDTVTTNNWHFFTVTYSNTFGNSILAPKIYVDDTLRFTPIYTLSTSSTINTGSLKKLRFGSNGNPVNSFKGSIDDIGIWKRVLTDCEISKLYYSRNNLIIKQPKNDTLIVSGTAVYSITDTGGAATYQWQENAGSGFVNLTNTGKYSGVTTKTLTITGVTIAMNGYNYRCIRNSSPCIDTSSNALLKVILAEGISSTEIENKISVFPNPTNGTIMINSNIDISDLELRNTVGQSVMKLTPNTKNYDLNLSELPNGVYLIRVNGIYTKRITKE